MYYGKKTLFLEFRKLRNWRRWVVAGGQMVASGRVVAGGHSEKIQKGWLAIAKLKPLSLFISPF